MSKPEQDPRAATEERPGEDSGVFFILAILLVLTVVAAFTG